MKFFPLIALILICSVSAVAQDKPANKEVNVTSQFKPTLKDAAKINFNATPPSTDTSKPKLQYSIPNQHLALAFTPGSLKPLALQVDTGGSWTNESYVKIGYGSLNTPFAQAGVSFGDGRNLGLNLYAKHSSSRGKIPLQDYSNSAIDANAYFKPGNNMEWDVRFGGLQEVYNKYGFEPKTISFPEDSTDVKFQTWRGRLSFHNINRTEFGLSYAPEMKIDVFNDQLSNSESNTYFNLPLQKEIGKEFAIDFDLTANLSRYKPEGKTAIANNYFSFSPSVFFKKPNLNVQAGIRPSWDNSDFKLFPNILVEFVASQLPFSFQVGWTGYLRNSGFQYQAGMNPWIWAPATVHNTMIEERYAGVKGSLGDHFSYSAKLAYNKVNNQPLFVNDTFSGKSFRVVNESEMKVANFGGELGYTVGEKFSIVSNLTVNNYHLKDEVKAWGLIPVEWKTNMRVQILKDLYLNSTLYAFDGPWSLTESGRKNLPAAFDLSAGLEFKIVKNVKLWAQFNNIFNKEYQRWNQYPVYGFNFLGGVVFSFAQKN
ncbi:MAG: hypothetical protein ACJ749_17260 [Flavisolibacter sp.]